MKKILLWLLISATSCPLFAQAKTLATIYLQPIEGVGLTLGDSTFITKMFLEEVYLRNYTLLRASSKADYIVYGKITPHYRYELDISQYSPSTAVHSYNSAIQHAWKEQWYVLQMTLYHKKTKKTVLVENLTYGSMDDLYNFLPLMIHNLLAHVTDQPFDRDIYGDTDDWLDKWLYLGVNAFWSPRVYRGVEQATFLVNFGGGASVDFHFLRFLSLAAGLDLISDWPRTVDDPDDTFQDILLEFPLSLQWTIRLSDYLMLGPYAGVHFNVPLLNKTVPPPCSWMIGLQFGINAGPGMFYIDPRFSMDIGDSQLNEGQRANPRLYQRFITHIGIGYKFGVIGKYKQY